MGIIISDNTIDQNRLLDPFASYDSLLTSQLLSGIYKEGNAIINGIQPSINAGTQLLISPGSLLNNYTLIHITQQTTFDLGIIPPVADGLYLVVVEYTYQLVKPAPLASLKLITPDAFNPSLMVIAKVVNIAGGIFTQLFDSAYDSGTSTTYTRQNAEFRLSIEVQNANNSNFPRESLTITTTSGQPRLILTDRTMINSFYELTVDWNTLEVILVPVTNFNDGDIYLHDSLAGTIAKDVHDGIYPKRIYVDNGVLLNEVQSRLRGEDLSFIDSLDTVGFTNGGPIYNLYSGSQVLVDQFFLQAVSFIAEESILMVSDVNDSVTKLTVDGNTGTVSFSLVPDPNIYIQGYAFIIDNNALFIEEDATDKIIKIDSINPPHYNYNVITQQDVCGFPDRSSVVIHISSNNTWWQLFYNDSTGLVDAIGIAEPTNKIILNDLDNINWENPTSTLTLINTHRLFTMDGKQTLEFADQLSTKAVKYLSDGSDVIQLEGFDGIGGSEAIIMENGSLMIRDTNDLSDQYRYEWDFDTQILNLYRDHFLKTNTDQVLPPTIHWLFRIKRELYHKLTNENGLEVYTPVDPTTLWTTEVPYLVHAAVTENNAVITFNQWETNGGLIFRRLSDEQRFRVEFDGSVEVEPISVGSILVGDIDLNEDRDLIFFDLISRNYYYLNKVANEITLTKSKYGVYGDNINTNYIDYQQDGDSIKWGVVGGQIQTIDYSIVNTVVIPPNAVILSDPFYDNPNINRIGFVDPFNNNNMVIEVETSGLVGGLRSYVGQIDAITVVNFDPTDVVPAQPTGRIVMRDNVTGLYYAVRALCPGLALDLITTIPDYSIIIHGRVAYWNSSGADIDDWRWEYKVNNGTFVIDVFDIYKDYGKISFRHIDNVSYPTIRDTPAPTALINYNVVGDGHSELNYDHVNDILNISAYVNDGAPNLEATPAYIIEDDITGEPYFIHGKDIDNMIYLELLSSVPVPPLHLMIYRGGIELQTVTASTNVYVLYLRNGNLEVEEYANIGLAPLPTLSRFEVLRPYNLPLPPNPIDIANGDQKFLPEVVDGPALPAIDNNPIAFTTEIPGTKARMVTVAASNSPVPYNISVMVDSLKPGDTYNPDGVVMKDIHDGRFYTVIYHTVNARFEVDQINLIVGTPTVYYNGINQKEGVSEEYHWIRLEDGLIRVDLGSDFE